MRNITGIKVSQFILCSISTLLYCTGCSHLRLPLSRYDRCWRLIVCLCPAAFWAIPARSAQLASSCSAGCAQAAGTYPVPLERLQALLILEETRLWNVWHSFNSFCWLGTSVPEYVAWDSTFVFLLFCFFATPFCLLAPCGYRVAAVMPGRQVKHYKDYIKSFDRFLLPWSHKLQ